MNWDRVPQHESIAFGSTTCSLCLSSIITKEDEVWKKLKRPVFGIDDDVLIPSGVQIFHRKCLKEFKTGFSKELQ